MTESRIERLAEAVLEAHGLPAPPVDVLALARRERIGLLPGHYDGCFEARIHYRRRRRRFVVFYAEAAPPGRPASRVRYTLAHELGHFFLPGHHAYLRSGRWLGVRADRVASRRLEREADWFAAALLMPRRPFAEAVRRRVGGRVCRLADLAALADGVFRTSLTSTALRYAQLDLAPCCVVRSERGAVRFAVASAGMRGRGLGWVARIPADSITGRFLAARGAGRGAPARGPVAGEVWLGGAAPGPVWEEVKLLGGTGLALTYLALAGPAGSPEAG
jgi:hypothetical protein